MSCHAHEKALEKPIDRHTYCVMDHRLSPVRRGTKAQCQEYINMRSFHQPTRRLWLFVEDDYCRDIQDDSYYYGINTK